MTHILLAEDNKGDILLIRRALAIHAVEHELHVVNDGEQAVLLVSQIGLPGGLPSLDLVILDLNLPRVDGPQILVELRSNPACAATAVIVVSSSNAPRDRARLAELGINRYFLKPTDLDGFMKLGTVVREVLGLQDAL